MHSEKALYLVTEYAPGGEVFGNFFIILLWLLKFLLKWTQFHNNKFKILFNFLNKLKAGTLKTAELSHLSVCNHCFDVFSKLH